MGESLFSHSWDKDEILQGNGIEQQKTGCLALKIGLDFQQNLGGGFKYFFMFTLILGEMIQFDEHIFQMGWFNHQVEMCDIIESFFWRELVMTTSSLGPTNNTI